MTKLSRDAIIHIYDVFSNFASHLTPDIYHFKLEGQGDRSRSVQSMSFLINNSRLPPHARCFKFASAATLNQETKGYGFSPFADH